MVVESFTLADDDFYFPASHGDRGRRFTPMTMPSGWSSVDSDVWTMWSPADTRLPEQGWKIHVSATMANADRVLDVVAAVCTRRGVPFKHLAGRTYFLLLHGKHASRPQSGKFSAIYPMTPELAHTVLEELSDALAGIAGPYVLTDRRYRDSNCVSYRFGSFRAQDRLEADGSSTPMMRSVDGRLVPDERRPEFALPEGMADPFAGETVPTDEADDSAEVSFNGYTFEKVLQYSNAGGAYRARDADGRQVFVKEARAHSGYLPTGSDARQRAEQEYLLLTAIDDADPGLCPRPVDFFQHWENHYLVTELVPGKTLAAWSVANTPVIKPEQPETAFAEYYTRCSDILAQLRVIVDRLHALGYVFVDLSPRNVMVDDEDHVRLIDFESAQRSSESILPLATPGFCPPQARDPQLWETVPAEHYDDYALAGTAQQLLFPMHQVVLRNPESVEHLLADLAEPAPVPLPLKQAMTRFVEPVGRRRLPTPASLRSQPDTDLAGIRARTVRALVAMAAATETGPLFPTAPEGYQSNTRCVAWGTAGVLHALHVAGVPIDPLWVKQLRDESLAAVDDTPPGLIYGTAGISWVLAELGEQEAADRLLAAACDHPLLTRSATLGGGSAGLALALIRRHCRSGDGLHLEQASRLLDTVPHGDDLVPLLGKNNASGYVEGRTGIAMALYYLGRLTGDDHALDRGMALLREELDQHAQAIDDGGVGFAVSAKDKRNMPYLYAGSAGFARVAARYLTVRDDPGLAAALEQCVRTIGVRFTVSCGLFQGQAGFALTLSELATLLSRPGLRRKATSAATALVKHAVPHDTGVRWLGMHNQRFTADLYSGSAGVLLALHEAITPSTDPLFSVDDHLPASGAPVAAAQVSGDRGKRG